MKKIFFFGILALLALTVIACFASCAAGPNTLKDVSPENQPRDPAGFWLGLWHGWIAVIVFVISWFSDSVNIYEVYNNGGWYNFGFLFGLGAIGQIIRALFNLLLSIDD